jgi:hypothetical protein
VSKLLSFDISYLYEDSDEGISLPVTLSYGCVQARTYAKMDMGSEFCVFSLELGAEGIKLKERQPALPEVFSSLIKWHGRSGLVIAGARWRPNDHSFTGASE